MVREIMGEVIDEHIEKVLSLLKKQNYISQVVALTTEERKKLYDFLFIRDEFGKEECIYNREYYELENQEDIDSLNQKVLENMDEEACALIAKCGVVPQKVFVKNKSGCSIDERLLSAMEAYGIAKVGEFTIEARYHRPIDMDSVEIKSFCEEAKQE